MLFPPPTSRSSSNYSRGEIQFAERPFRQRRVPVPAINLELEKHQLLFSLKEEVLTSKNDLERLEQILRQVCGMVQLAPFPVTEMESFGDIQIQENPTTKIRRPAPDQFSEKELEDIEISLRD